MAEEEQDEAPELDEAIGKKGKTGKIILIVLLVLLLVGGAVVGTLFYTGALGGGDKDEEKSKDEGAGTEQAEAKEPLGPAIYYVFKPEFVVNFEGDQKAEFLQVEIQLMTRKEDVLKIIEEHMPMVRNNILLLLSSQRYEQVSTLAGKEKLREEVLAVVQKVVEAEYGSPGVEAVFFTNFIMQ